jgi:hypothetical protein
MARVEVPLVCLLTSEENSEGKQVAITSEGSHQINEMIQPEP